jgi:hypothetical protein
MRGIVVVFLKLVPGSEGDPITVERVSFLPEESRGLAELRRLSDEFREPERQSYTSI